MKKYYVSVLLLFAIGGHSLSANKRINRVLGSANWGTHMTPLITAVSHTEGPILEMGCGDFSTPILHAICSPTKRFLLTTESHRSWMDLFLDLKNDWHHFEYVTYLCC